MAGKSNASRSAPEPAANLDAQLVNLGAMSVEQLRAVWTDAFDSPPPGSFSKDLLARAVAYRLQEEAFGGLNASTARLLRTMSKVGAEPPREVKVGSVIVREHKGVLHEVLVVPGGFSWRGETYDSLSAIARKITGVSWNGPRFFGLRSKEPSENPDQEHATDVEAAKTKLRRRARRGGAGGRRSSIGVAGSAGRAP
jgi:hypothetical protein